MYKRLDPIFAGALSEGTLRPRDLIPLFADTLAEVHPRHRLVREWFQISVEAQRAAIACKCGPRDALEAVEWWSSTAALDLLDGLQRALERIAPEGTHFGAHPDDGACFGFWSYA